MADESVARLSPAKRELLRRLRAEAGPRLLGDAPVAVIGLSLRLPGAPDRATLWRLLSNSIDAIREVPSSRWPIDALHHPDPHHAGTMASRFGGFIEDVEQFDAGLFSLSPREAASMDPQHRLLLEHGELALEDAGLPRTAVAGRAMGVFLACYQRDYARLAAMDRRTIDAYSASGTHHSMIAGRLAYGLDVHGPALVVDTACSSSLVALHLACRSLLAGEIELALVGASNLMLAPEETIALSRWGMLAPDGRCKPFDADADGFVRGEGVVMLVLARLRDAIAQERRVRAVVVGSAVNQDGRSNGLTAPSARAQAAVIRAALHDAELDAGAVGYVEAHGTGTSLGDPIEMQALIESYGAASDVAPVCGVGSIKSNIGHLEACAGLAGVAKAIACLEHGELPATLHHRRLNPAIDPSGSRIEVVDRPRAWPSAGLRHAGVSSFGMGGTNAHVILREAAVVSRPAGIERSAFVLPLSAHEPGALRELIEATRGRLGAREDVATYCAAAARGRTHREQVRVAVVGGDAAELSAALSEREQLRVGGRVPRGVVFCCPGQGGQWVGMGRALLEREPVFAAALRECDAAIGQWAPWSVIDELRGGALEAIERVQPALFALTIAYAALWRSFGVEPDAVIGHSMGEVAAAVIAGRLSLLDGARVIVRRSALMATLPRVGAMVAVDLSARELRARAGELAVAAENGPRSSVLAGEREAVDAMVAVLEREGVRCRRIAVGVASHSPAVEPLDAALAEALAGLDPQPGELAFYSTVVGERLGAQERLDANYWRRNLRDAVQLWPAVRLAIADRHELFIELGPHPVLLPAVQDGLDELAVRALVIGSGRREQDEQRELCNGLAALYEAGLTLAWDRIYAGARTDVELPSYPFQRRAYWLPMPISRQRADAGPHPFLGARVELPRQGAAPLRVWTRTVTLDDAPFLRDHLVEGSCVLPGMGSVDLVLSGAREAGLGEVELRELVFERPIVLAEDEALELQLRIDGESFEGESFEIWARSRAGDEWIRRSRGRVVPAKPAGPALELSPMRARAQLTHDHAGFYAALNRSGNVWGPAFAGVQAIARDGEGLLVDLAIPPSIASELWRHCFHPALLDACAQAMLADQLEAHGSLVLAAIDRLAIHGEAGRVHASWIRLDPEQRGGSLRGDVIVVDEQGQRLVEIEGLRVQFIHEQQHSWFHRVVWRSLEDAVAGTEVRRLAFVGGGEALERVLAGRGVERVAVEQGEDVVFVVDAAAVPDEQLLDVLVQTCVELLARAGEAARLWLVTRGAVAAGGTRCDPLHAAVWGLGQVLAVELGRRFVRAIDLDPDPDADDVIAALLDELQRDDDEPRVALRAGQRLGARLESHGLPASASASPLAQLDPAATYLITGGLGGLGLRMAEHLIDRGARRLILLGRSELPPRASWAAISPEADPRIQAVRRLEARGADIHLAALDIGDVSALRELVERWTAEGRSPIRGVVHAAGVQHPRPLTQLDAPTLRDDLRAKVAGAVAIEQVLGPALDYLLLFSSAATLLPSPLLGAYTAANAFLDGMASRLRAQGRRVCSVAWGLIGSGGMAQRHAAARGGLDAFVDMDAAAAFAALDRAWAASLDVVGVLAIDWPSWLRDHEQAAASPYFAELRGEARATVAGETAGVIWTELDPSTRRDALEAFVRRALARVLRLEDRSGQGIAAELPLITLGIDSLMSLELRNRIEAETGAAPAVVELLRGISLARLIELCAAQLDAAQPDDWEEFTI